MTIEKAGRSDLPAILELQKLCYREVGERYGDFSIPPLTQTVEGMKDDFIRGPILKITLDSRIIGSTRAYEDNGAVYIGRVIVHPDYQNQGFGKILMRAVEELFPQAKRFELFTGCRDEKSIHFYGSLGYRKFKEEPERNLIFLEKKIFS
ncbi:MAG: GNAT family N-acetyltransferase [Spirochaetales bacterium]|nr:GNAT family N-acetyltransferase [Spirochaetales bacterium]